MGTKRSIWSLVAGVLAAGCAVALAIVTVDMVVDQWITPLSFGTAAIMIEMVLAAVAAVLFFVGRPLWGLITAAAAFVLGEVLGRTITDGNGIYWPFRAIPDLAVFAEYSQLWALALLCLDVAFVLLLAALVTGLVAALVPGGTTPAVQQAAVVTAAGSAEQGIPAGWYRDPEGKPCQRYWDGAAWTDSTAPLG